MLRNGITFEAKFKELKSKLNNEHKLFESIQESQHLILGELSEYTKRRAEIETEYHRNLKRLHQRFNEKRNDSRRNYLIDQGFPSIKAIWDILLNRLKNDFRIHEQHAHEYMHIIVPRLVQSDEFIGRVSRKSTDISSKYHAELEDQMKKLDRTLKYYIQSRQSEHNAKSKLSDVRPAENGKLDSKIERRLSKRKQKHSEKMKDYQQSRNEFLLQLTATEASIETYFSSSIHQVFNSRSLGFHEIVRGTFKAALQSERNLINDRLERVDENLRCIQQIDSVHDQERLRFLLPELFKQFELGIQVQDRNLSLTEDLFSQIERQKLTLDENLEGITDRIKMLKADQNESYQLLIEHMPNMSSAIPPANSIEAISRLENERKYFSSLGESSQMEIQAAKITAKKDEISKCLDRSNDLIVKIRSKRDHATRDTSVRKSHYFTPQTKLFGGILVDYVKDSGNPIPRIISSCVRTINLYGFCHQGIFRVPGLQADLNRLQEAFEAGEDPLAELTELLEYDINSIAGLLKLYLRKLDEKLIPDSIFTSVNEASAITSEDFRIEKLKIILKNVPDSILIVMRYLFQFLNHLSQYSDENMMDAYNLAVCFGPSIIDIPPLADPVMCQASINSVIKTMIENVDEVFPDSLDGPQYERHIAQVAPNDSELNQNDSDGNSVATDCASAPSSPSLNHQFSSGSSAPTNSPPLDCNSTGGTPTAFPYHSFEFSKKISECSIDDAYNAASPDKKKGSPDSPQRWMMVTALYDYRARSARELALQKGCTILLKERLSTDWWKGKVNGLEGLVPHIYVNLDEAESVDAQKLPSTSGLSRNRFGDQSLRVPNNRNSKHHQINHIRRRSYSEKHAPIPAKDEKLP